MASPLRQQLNALVHKEPFATILYCAYWSCFFLIVPPLMLSFLPLQMVWKLTLWITGTNANRAHDPKRNKKTELAIVITGCDSGFGKELAVVAAQAGFVVFAGCLLEKSFAQFDYTDQIHPLQMDVTQDKDVAAAHDKVKAWLHQGSAASKKRVLHALVNNAGIGAGGTVDMTDISVYQRVMNVNFFGVIRCCKGFLPLFKQQTVERSHSGSRIVNLTSMAGIMRPVPGMSAYGCSKIAATALSCALRQEMRDFGIQVATICPSFHGTPLTDNMYEQTKRHWEAIPKETREEYGEETFEHFVKMLDRIKGVTWSADGVIDSLMATLLCRSPPAESFIGLDARFALPPLIMAPAWLAEWCYKVMNPAPPVPKILRRRH